jgi:hypothetical protein
MSRQHHRFNANFLKKNFIIISASVAGVIIIVVGSLMVLYWLNKLPGQHQHKTNELHRDKPDNITWSSFSPNNYMHNESYVESVMLSAHCFRLVL